MKMNLNNDNYLLPLYHNIKLKIMEKEIWKEVFGFSGIYEVSNTGKVRSVDRSIVRINGRPTIFKGKELNFSLDKDGYRFVQFNVNNKRSVRKIHRLVYESFVGSLENRLVIDHIDNDKNNNNVSNLQQITNRLNVSKDSKKKYNLPTCVYKNSKGCGFRTNIQVDNVNIYIGSFKTIEEADNAYKKALNDYDTLGVVPKKIVQRNMVKDGMKVCPACGINKPLNEYYIANKIKGTRHAKCKKCIIEYNKQQRGR